MQYAWYQASRGAIRLPRLTYDQVISPLVRAIPNRSDMQPGDLIFIAQNGSYDHVVMYLGGGKIIEEPHTGSVSRIMPLSEYDGMAQAIRRVKAT